MVGELTTRNGSVVVVSSRVARILHVDSHVVIVYRNGVAKGVSVSRTARRRVVGRTAQGVGWKKGS